MALAAVPLAAALSVGVIAAPFGAAEAQAAAPCNYGLLVGEIRVKYFQGSNEHVLGCPVTPELGTPDRRGRYNHFQRGSIYWTPSTRAQLVIGDIRRHWERRGWENSCLGYPTTGEISRPPHNGGQVKLQYFERGSITWTERAVPPGGGVPTRKTTLRCGSRGGEAYYWR